MSATTGILYGTIIAIIDLEDLYLRTADLVYLMEATELMILGPLGIILGAFCSTMFIVLRILEMQSRQKQ